MEKFFSMSPTQWIKRTNAIGIISKGGKYSIGTFAHPDIAFEFASWLSPEFKLYLIKEFERLKVDEAYQNNIEWNVRRIISKGNYKIHTDAIKDKLILPMLTRQQINYTYALLQLKSLEKNKTINELEKLNMLNDIK